VAGRSPAEALENFLLPLRQAVGCVTSAQIDRLGEKPVPGRLYPLTISGGQRVKVRRDVGEALSIRVTQHYRIVKASLDRGPWKVQTAAYSYTLETLAAHEIVAYHWHPDAPGPSFPHLHIGFAAGTIRDELQKAHCPTGRIALEQFLRLVIEEFGITAKKGWSDVLANAQVAFEQWRTWA